MYCTVRIVEYDATTGQKLDKPTSDVSICNNFFGSLWSHISVKLNDFEVNPNTGASYHIRSYIEQMLSFTDEAQKIVLEPSGFIPDKLGSWDKNEKVADDKTSGYALRKAKIADSKQYHLVSPLFLDIFSSLQYVVPNTTLQLEFQRFVNSFFLSFTLIDVCMFCTCFCYRAKDEIALISKEIGKKFGIEILDMRLGIRVVRVSPELLEFHNSQLLSKQGQMPMIVGKLRISPIPQSMTTYRVQSICATGQLPQVMLVVVSACGGIRTDNSMPVLPRFPMLAYVILGKGGLFVVPLLEVALLG